jgi:hypothetical protein
MGSATDGNQTNTAETAAERRTATAWSDLVDRFGHFPSKSDRLPQRGIGSETQRPLRMHTTFEYDRGAPNGGINAAAGLPYRQKLLRYVVIANYG